MISCSSSARSVLYREMILTDFWILFFNIDRLSLVDPSVDSRRSCVCWEIHPNWSISFIKTIFVLSGFPRLLYFFPWLFFSSSCFVDVPSFPCSENDTLKRMSIITRRIRVQLDWYLLVLCPWYLGRLLRNIDLDLGKEIAENVFPSLFLSYFRRVWSYTRNLSNFVLLRVTKSNLLVFFRDYDIWHLLFAFHSSSLSPPHIEVSVFFFFKSHLCREWLDSSPLCSVSWAYNTLWTCTNYSEYHLQEIICFSDLEVIVDHEDDMSSSKKSVFILHFLSKVIRDQ